MQTDPPDFAALLGPFLQRLAAPSRPAFLAALERVAASRYRDWAQQAPRQAASLLACAEREEEIASTALRLFPPGAPASARIAELLPEAGRVYASVLAGLTLAEQWRIQALAERSGAAAWRAFSAELSDPALRDALRRCAELEEASARQLDALIAEQRAGAASQPRAEA